LQNFNAMFLKQLLWVGLGGMIGTILRFLVGTVIRNTQFPLATLVVNLSGSFLIGLFMGWYLRQAIGSDGKLLLVTGICGGFTTLSALSWENWQLLQDGKYGLLIGYSLITVIGGVGCVALGYFFSK